MIFFKCVLSLICTAKLTNKIASFGPPFLDQNLIEIAKFLLDGKIFKIFEISI